MCESTRDKENHWTKSNVKFINTAVLHYMSTWHSQIVKFSSVKVSQYFSVILLTVLLFNRMVEKIEWELVPVSMSCRVDSIIFLLLAIFEFLRQVYEYRTRLHAPAPCPRPSQARRSLNDSVLMTKARSGDPSEINYCTLESRLVTHNKM